MFHTQVLHGSKLMMADAKEREETGVEDVEEVVVNINENKGEKELPKPETNINTKGNR